MSRQAGPRRVGGGQQGWVRHVVWAFKCRRHTSTAICCPWLLVLPWSGERSYIFILALVRVHHLAAPPASCGWKRYHALIPRPALTHSPVPLLPVLRPRAGGSSNVKELTQSWNPVQLPSSPKESLLADSPEVASVWPVSGQWDGSASWNNCCEHCHTRDFTGHNIQSGVSCLMLLLSAACDGLA